MSWRKRIGLVLGLLSVLLLAAGLTMVVNANAGEAASKSASLAAEDYPVGTDYSGTITSQYVHVGDHVDAGQPMFEVESAGLQRDLAQGLVNKDNLTHEVKDDKTLVITATNAGTVNEVQYAAGAFVPQNSTIATVQEAGTMYVEADFLLSPKDFQKIAPDATVDVELPNNQTVTAQVKNLQVKTSDGQALTTIRAYSDNLANGTGLFTVGTPVQATLHLTNDGVVTDVTKTVTGWFGQSA